MSLQDALKQASEQHRLQQLEIARQQQIEQAKLQEERLLEYHSSLYSRAATYDNAVILAGFAAFFALWAGVSGDIPSLARTVTVGLMGISLMLYIAVTIGLMLLRQFHLEYRISALFEQPADPEKFNEAYEKVQADFNRRQAKAIPAALVGFWTSLFFGFAAGIVLTYTAFGMAFGWPVLTG